ISEPDRISGSSHKEVHTGKVVVGLILLERHVQRGFDRYVQRVHSHVRHHAHHFAKALGSCAPAPRSCVSNCNPLPQRVSSRPVLARERLIHNDNGGSTCLVMCVEQTSSFKASAHGFEEVCACPVAVRQHGPRSIIGAIIKFDLGCCCSAAWHAISHSYIFNSRRMTDPIEQIVI